MTVEHAPARGIRNISLLWRSPLLGAIAASTAIMVLLRLALRYSYGAGFEEAFPEADDLTRFIGSYTMIASVVGILLQILATPTLLRRLGVGTMNVAYSLLMGLSFLGSAFAPGLWTSAAGRFTDQDLKSAIKTPLSAIFYEPLGEKNRTGGRALILGIVSPISSLVSSLMLVTVAAMGLDAWKVAAAGSALSLVFVVLSWMQGRAYRKELGAHLLGWAKNTADDQDVTLREAIKKALESGDRRIEDMARELRKR
jgi:ATP/ADP translocase